MSTTLPSNLDLLAPPPPPPSASTLPTVDGRFNCLSIVIAYIVSLLVIVTVLHRLYSHMYHFTPPYRQAYEELIAARGLVHRGAIEFADHHDNYTQHFRPDFRPVATMASDPRGEGTSGSGGGGGLEGDEFSRKGATAAAVNADLPTGRSFVFPIRANSSRTTLPAEFDRSLDSLNRATQSARFTHVIVSPSPSTPVTSSSAAALGNNNSNNSNQLVSPRRNRSELSFQALIMPSTGLDGNFHDRDLHRAIRSARFSAGNTQSSLSIILDKCNSIFPGVVRDSVGTFDV
ncbi:unnamed protein product [Calypogeia fissa]